MRIAQFYNVKLPLRNGSPMLIHTTEYWNNRNINYLAI